MALLAKVVLAGRAHDRSPVRLDGTLRVEDEPFDIVIDDLSVGGFGATTDVDLQPGDHVLVGSPAIQVREAEVIWARGGKVGFEFVSPLREFEVASAEQVNTVVSLPASDFGAPSAWRSEWQEPEIEKWPRFLRAAFILGSSIALWAIIVALATLAARNTIHGAGKDATPSRTPQSSSAE